MLEGRLGSSCMSRSHSQPLVRSTARGLYRYARRRHEGLPALGYRLEQQEGQYGARPPVRAIAIPRRRQRSLTSSFSQRAMRTTTLLTQQHFDLVTERDIRLARDRLATEIAPQLRELIARAEAALERDERRSRALRNKVSGGALRCVMKAEGSWAWRMGGDERGANGRWWAHSDIRKSDGTALQPVL